ncbi:hypothetical protein KLEP181_gp59 [Paracoccus phage vB_PmaP_KLEP18-1]|nr:hypothetical protein KLEP181_gp59 [Paracoccus phage vB_PmaP_KLEP18-1]
MEVGTLKELNVQPGDVVTPAGWDIGLTMGKDYQVVDRGDGPFFIDDDGDAVEIPVMRIVSRATPAIDLTAITTPFGLLDAATQEALRAHGGPYEYFYMGEWYETDTIDDRDTHWVHRVKPAPKRETVVFDGWIWNDDGRIWLVEADTPVRVTFDRVYGKIDLASYRVEAR